MATQPHAGQHGVGSLGEKPARQFFSERFRPLGQCREISGRALGPDHGRNPDHTIFSLLENTAAQFEPSVGGMMAPGSDRRQAAARQRGEAAPLGPDGQMCGSVIERIERGWRARVQPEKAQRLGFASDASFEDTVRWFLEDDVLLPA